MNKDRVMEIILRLEELAIERHENDKLLNNLKNRTKDKSLWSEQWELKIELLNLTNFIKVGDKNDSTTL